MGHSVSWKPVHLSGRQAQPWAQETWTAQPPDRHPAFSGQLQEDPSNLNILQGALFRDLCKTSKTRRAVATA